MHIPSKERPSIFQRSRALTGRARKTLPFGNHIKQQVLNPVRSVLCW